MYWFHNRGHFVGFDVISLLLWCTSSKIICILCVFWTRDLDCCSCWDWYWETVLFSHLECLSSECFTLCLLPLCMYCFLWPKNMKKWRLGKNVDFFFHLLELFALLLPGQLIWHLVSSNHFWERSFFFLWQRWSARCCYGNLSLPSSENTTVSLYHVKEFSHF